MDKARVQFLPAKPLNTAVLFMMFNWPHGAEQVFRAIRRAQPPRLYFAADGQEKIDSIR